MTDFFAANVLLKTKKNPILLHCAFNLANIFQSCFFLSQEQYCTNKERMREGHEKSFSTFFSTLLRGRKPIF